MNEYTSGQGVALQQVLKNGFTFSVPKSFTGFLSKNKSRKFVIKPLFISEVDKICHQASLLDIDEGIIDEEGVTEAKRLTRKHAYRCCRIIAIGILGNMTIIPGATTILTAYLYHHIDSSKMWQLQNMVQALCNFPAIVWSVRNLSAARTTTPVKDAETKEEVPAE